MAGLAAKPGVEVRFNGLELYREREPDATECYYCGEERQYRNQPFFSYDDYNALAEGIHAFCNLRCYGAFLASGRMSTSRTKKLKQLRALIVKLEKDEAAEAARKRRKPSKKSGSGGGRRLRSVA